MGMFVSMTAAQEEKSPRLTPLVQVMKEWAPSIVNISTERVVIVRTHPFWKLYGNLFDEFYNQFGQSGVGTMKLNSLGSGVIVSGDGLIMTNAHVVTMASKIYVVLSNGAQAEAVLIAVKPEFDLALIKITTKTSLKPVKVAADVLIGETVVAVGNPFGLENSVSSGIISGVNRKFFVGDQQNFLLDGLLQTDAPINFGSSGGALLNLAGELVGINLAVAQNAQGIGFAVPYNQIQKMLDEYAAGELKAPAESALQIPVNAIPSGGKIEAKTRSITLRAPVKNK